jgi:hypothetical protein
MAETSTPFNADPTTAFHTFAIGWFPKTCAGQVNSARGTAYRYDGAIMQGPVKFPSIHPSRLIINLWSNGDVYFSAGPPARDAVVTIKKVTAYYDRPTKIDNGACIVPSGCGAVAPCSVNI